MKRLLVALLPVLLMLPSAGSAQYKGEWNAFVSVGPSIPMKPEEFKRYWEVGYNIGGGVGYGISTVLRTLVSIRYHDHDLNGGNLEDALLANGTPATVSGGRLTHLTIMGHLKYVPWPGEYVQPYLIAGAGWLRQEIQEIDVVAGGEPGTYRGRSENALVTSLAVGAEIMVWDHASLFGELGFASANTERETHFLPYHFGIMVKL
jgi:opacity protein-like surface antigen